MNRLFRCLILSAFAAAPAAMPLWAADVYWNVPSGDMNNAANWSPQQLPTSSDGTYIVNGGTAVLSSDYLQSLGEVYVGNGSGNGILRVNGGTITTGDIFLGDYSTGSSNGSGAFYQSGGTVNMNGTIVMGGYNTDSPTNYGYLALSNGTLNVNGWEFMVAWVDTGVVDQSGGTLNAPFQSMRVGYYGNAYGVYNLTGGTINTSAWEPVFGQMGTGILNVSGGLFKANVYGILLGWDGGTGIVNVGAVASGSNPGGGGTIDTAYIFQRSGVGSGTVNFHGGTIKVHAASAGGPDRSNLDFFGAANCYVYGEGAVFDTAGTPAQINNPLQAPTGFGLTSIPLVNGGSAYIGAPAVQISGGSGTGATAVATVVGGVVTGFTITNPGTGYQPGDTLSVTLSGGGTTNPATVGAIGAANFAANISGGLTKHGAGTLTLNAPCTYTGPTVVDGGTLALTGGSLASSNIDVKSGGTLAGYSGPYPNTTVETGGTVAPGTPIQTLYINQLTFANNSNLNFTFSSGSSDSLYSYSDISAAGSKPVTVNLTYSGAISSYTTVLSAVGNLDSNITFALPGGKPVLDSPDGINTPAAISTTYGLGGSVALIPGGAIADPAWSNVVGGNWNTATNWGTSGPVPNGGDKRGMFTGYLGVPVTVNLNVSPRLSSMVFSSPDGTESYTITPTGSNYITLDSSIAENWSISVLSGAQTVAANLHLGAGSGQSAIRLAMDSNLTLSGVLSNETAAAAAVNFSGNFSIGGTNPGVLTLAGLNAYTGPTTVDAGTLVVTNLGPAGSPSSIGAASADAANLVFSNATLDYTGSAAATTNRGFTMNGNLTFNSDQNVTISGQVVGSNQNVFSKGGAGTLTLSNSTNALTTNQIEVTNGTLASTGGTVTANQIGVTNGSLLLSGGTLTTNQAQVANGVMVLSGGTFNVRSPDIGDPASAIYVSGNAQFTDSQLGWQDNDHWGPANGYMSISGNATITTSGGIDIRVGMGTGMNIDGQNPLTLLGNTGVVDQTGGTVVSYERLQMAMASSTSNAFGVYNLSGGSLQSDGIRWGDVIAWGGGPAGTPSTGIMSVYGTGVYRPQSGSTALAGGNAVGILNIGGVAAANGGAGAGGGLVSVADIQSGGGQAILNFHGGTLQAAAASASLLPSGAAIYVYGENATIDTNGVNCTVSGPLLAPTGNGLTAITLSAPGSGYVGAPAVEITGGGGAGATAMAVMNGGQVDHIVITNPGVGYTSAPTVTLVGGGNGVTAAAAATLGANASGGLTKTGAGTLTLLQNNTYTGPTVVTNGTLQLSLSHQAMRTAPGAQGDYNNGPYAMGQSFTTNTSLQVTQLGVFDSSGDGLAGPHVVHITDLTTNTDTAAVENFAIGSGTYSNGYRFLPLSSPVNVPAGNYMIWVDYMGGGLDAFSDQSQTVLDGGTTGAITFGECYYSTTTGSVPTTDWGSTTIGSTVSFMYYDPASLVTGNMLATTTAVVLGGPAGSNPTLDLAGVNQQVASLVDVAGAAVKGSVINSLPSVPVTLTLGATSGTTTFSGSIGAAINLVKTGDGTQILTGSLASYDGNTTVDAGTLTVSSLNTPSSTVYVAADATLNAGSIVADTLTIGGTPTVSSVPEPSSLALLALAAAALAGMCLRRNR